MARHADPDPRHFWRSLAAAFARATLALGLVVGLFAALSTIGDDPPGDGPAMLGGPEAIDDGALPLVPEGHEDTDGPKDSDDDADTEDAEDDAAAVDAGEGPVAAAAAPEETRVQVLDGVNDPARLAELVAALEALGYQVVTTNPASTAYAVTTVLYSEGQESAAQALQIRDPRMAVLRPSPGLSDTVDLHVVLGADWTP
ncbi:MAG: LytR C-terminal domain-containing protein [Egibacteraceae bacterium]